MKIAIISHKGGPGKTTTAIHLAAYLQTLGPTLLLDADDELRSAKAWGERGPGLPFRIETGDDGAGLMDQFAYVVIDTAQAQKVDDLRAAQAICDVLVIASPVAGTDPQGVGRTINALRQIGPDKFVVLLTKVAHNAGAKVAKIREDLKAAGVTVLEAEIPYLAAFVKAAEDGTLVTQVHDKHKARAWAAVVQAGKEITTWA